MTKLATLKEIAQFFGMASAEFRQELPKLTPADKMQLATGIGDGTLNYH
jgi:hypothetical protein